MGGLYNGICKSWKFLGKKVCNNQVITTEIGYFEVDTEFKVVHEDKSDGLLILVGYLKIKIQGFKLS